VVFLLKERREMVTVTVFEDRESRQKLSQFKLRLTKPGYYFPEGVFTVLFLAQKSNQNTWFSVTLDFSLVFPWFSAFSPILCTVVSKKPKFSCFGRFFPWFSKSKQQVGFLGVVYI
jgi:hypothetical protein